MILDVGLVVAAALALFIGANNAGVAFGPAYGAGAVGRRAALVLSAVFYLLGAFVLGPRVTSTLGEGLFDGDLASHAYALILVAPAATLSLVVLATLLRVPIATTHAAVASLVGVGLVLDVVRGPRVLEMLAWWAATPGAAFIATWIAARATRGLPLRSRRIGPALVASGALLAVAVGTNNPANAVAPLVGTGVLGALPATLAGAAVMGIGAIAWGGGVLDTVGRGIVSLDPVRSIVVAFVSGATLLAASWAGVPVSLALIVTVSVIAYKVATEGVRETWTSRTVRRIALVWTTSPLIAVASTYALAWALKGVR